MNRKSTIGIPDAQRSERTVSTMKLQRRGWLQLRRWYQGNRKRSREWKGENGPMMNKLSSSRKGAVMFRSYRKSGLPVVVRHASVTLNSALTCPCACSIKVGGARRSCYWRVFCNRHGPLRRNCRTLHQRLRVRASTLLETWLLPLIHLNRPPRHLRIRAAANFSLEGSNAGFVIGPISIQLLSIVLK